ncbi:MAG: hypothetical protein LBD90_04090 [Bifidobacteriaceae bacterium]|nr:hypothetical protein [Bifidobacteriaceae bacterium]
MATKFVEVEQNDDQNRAPTPPVHQAPTPNPVNPVTPPQPKHATADTISDAHTMLAGRLDWPHQDPFDRLVAAVAMVEGLPLISGDPIFATLDGLTVIW